MARIVQQYDNWENLLAPRLILGLWHPLFLKAAYKHLPLLKRFHIGFSPSIVRKFFWDHCDGFSICFPLLMAPDGQAFLEECRAAGKEICVWTVNNEDEMRIAIGWGVKAVLTDRVALLSQVKKEAGPLLHFLPEKCVPAD
jgi:glycerophosphoryl diester phosphodiesterase